MNQLGFAKFFLISLVSTGMATSFAAEPTNLDDSEIIGLEQVYTKPKPVQPPPQPTKVPPADSASRTATQNSGVDRSDVPMKTEEDSGQLKDFSGLGKLAPFTEISVIQKRFLPKTGRFQLFGGLLMTTNNPWFLNAGANVRLGYNFIEELGIEFSYSALSNSEREVTKEALDIHRIRTEELVYAKSAMGLSLQWAPIYGKMSWFNQRIVPFDIYFNLGAGQTAVSTGGQSFTLNFGLGQVFALSKQTAFRWDYSYSTYNAKGVDGIDSRYNDLILTAGFSFFWPEANYR